jgi:hypothetical protein
VTLGDKARNSAANGQLDTYRPSGLKHAR